MTVRHLVAALIGLSLAAAPALAQNVTPRHRPTGVNAREHRQAQRIREGKQEGELTKGELDKLRADEAAIRAKEKVYRKSGNGLNKAERKDLEQDLDKTSREIYRDKHNARKPL